MLEPKREGFVWTFGKLIMFVLWLLFCVHDLLEILCVHATWNDWIVQISNHGSWIDINYQPLMVVV